MFCLILVQNNHLKFVLLILISKDSESIEGDPIIIEYVFTVVTTNYILLYDMNNIMFLNMMVSF